MGKSDEVATGTLQVAIANASRLLASQPDLAEQQAMEILRAMPGNRHGRLILGQARNRLDRFEEALAVLEPLALEEPESALVRLEAAMAHSLLGHLAPAIAGLREATRLRPDWPEAWRQLADHLEVAGDGEGADRARSAFLTSAVNDPRLRAAADALQANELGVAEPMLRSHLKEHPTDVAAMRMLAEVAARLRRYHAAQTLLERAIELAPGFRPARHQLAIVLFRQSRAAEARAHVEALMAEEPHNLGYFTLHAAILAHLGETEASARAYEAVLRHAPRQAHLWMSYGHVLKTAGRTPDCVAAFRRAVDILPTLGEAWWSLANLKTFRFEERDEGAMALALRGQDLSDEDRLHFEYALGKAREDAGDWGASFAHYQAGADIRRRLQPYRADDAHEHVAHCRTLYTPSFFAERAGAGCPAPDPVFILGMPRSGSTLLEQIIASHPQVEGTAELPNMPEIVRELAEKNPGEGRRYPGVVAGLAPQELRALGERYLEETRIFRKGDAPFFIDKMPNNFLHTGLIHLLLPNARIIDARRHPMACCFSNFKQHFARGQNYSYSLRDLGAFYRDYVALMAHFDEVLPGRVLRVIYEDVVEDPEGQVRRMLDHCGLPFDGRCLRFHENERAVRTASAEQVRRPINREGLDQWTHFEPWLGPLRESLGPVLETWRN